MTTPNLYDEKEVMEEFISCYKHFTALWDINSKAYLSKIKKDPGYQELLKILKCVNRDATVNDVKRKINSLRSGYRRELKKVQMSCGGYETRLWWFHLMDFLRPVLYNVESPPHVKHDDHNLDDSPDDASLHLYRGMPELWHVGSKEYRNRKLKAPAYARLLAHMRKEEPKVNIHMVKRKINNLRTSYRRELRKVIQSKSMGDEEYIPSLWYFNELDFLHEMETGEALTMVDSTESEYIKENVSEKESENEVETDDIFTDPFQNEDDMFVVENEADISGEDHAETLGDTDSLIDDVDPELNESVSPTRYKSDVKSDIKYQQHHSNSNNSMGSKNSSFVVTNQTQNQLRRSANPVTQQSMRRRRRSSDGDYEPNSAANKKRRQMISHSEEQTEIECDLIGKRIAAHFRNMRVDQRLFAERIISEVLVYGRMNRLSLSARFLPNGENDRGAGGNL